MIKLPLEQLLEAGLFALNAELGRRIYGEEILAGASVDDELGKSSIDKFREILEHGTPEQKLFAALSSDLSEEQHCVFNDNIPFFKRISGEYNRFQIEYYVYSKEKSDNYELNADNLINQDKIESEIVYISSNRIPRHDGFVNITFISIKDGKNYPELIESDFLDAFSTKADSKMKLLDALSEKDYNPKEVYEAVINLIS